MQVKNAHWEIQNLGYATAEIEINSESEFCIDKLIELEDSYRYLVVKTPVSSPRLWRELWANGYCIIECQLDMQKKITKKEQQRYSHFFSSYDYLRVDSRDWLQIILSEVNKGMFTTDRIAIDPNFGIEVSSRRYCNWIESMFDNENIVIDAIFVDEIEIGFACNRVIDSDHSLLGMLGGIYLQYQERGYALGMFSPVFKSSRSDVWYHRTSVSLNNLAVIRIYEFLGYHFTKCKYVFTKVIGG